MIVLLRHPEVTSRWRGICYGQTDVETESFHISKIIDALPALPFQKIYHSGLLRTQALALALAKHFQSESSEEARLRERNFGGWEGLTWDAIYAATGSAMDGFLSAPGTFAPAGGETTLALRDRVLAWYLEQPADAHILAVTHQGPILALCGTLAGLEPVDWFTFQTPCLGIRILPGKTHMPR
jgi:broad specificity phosphatase PhoE